jgi:hypothetical protein
MSSSLSPAPKKKWTPRLHDAIHFSAAAKADSYYFADINYQPIHFITVRLFTRIYPMLT